MKAMVFAAGLGTRLKEITKTKPKCLVEAGGKTLLEHVLTRLKSHGVDSVIINLFYLGDQIEEYLKIHQNFGLDIHFSREETLLGTGGGLKKARRFFEGEKEFIVYNGDVYSDIDLSAMVDAHRSRDALVSLGVMNRSTNRPLLFDRSDMLCGWENVSEGTGEVFGADAHPTHLAFSGVQIVGPKIFDYMEEDDGEFSTIRVYLRAARVRERVLAYRMDEHYWIDVGTPETLLELQRSLAKGDSLN